MAQMKLKNLMHENMLKLGSRHTCEQIIRRSNKKHKSELNLEEAETDDNVYLPTKKQF